MKKVAVIMGSDSDWGVVQKGVKVLKSLEIPFEVHIMSAHRTPEAAAEFTKNAEKNGFGVIIAAAGRASCRCACGEHDAPRDRYSDRVGRTWRT